MIGEHNCGNCMYHIPTDEHNPKALRSGEGKGKAAYWVCKRTKKGKYYTDGSMCNYFQNRYDSDARTIDWLENVNNEKQNYARLRHFGLVSKG